jgi:hypothetical protein
MLPYALQDVYQVGVDVNTVEPTSHDEALHDTHLFSTQRRTAPCVGMAICAARISKTTRLHVVLELDPSNIGANPVFPRLDAPFVDAVVKLCPARAQHPGIPSHSVGA